MALAVSCEQYRGVSEHGSLCLSGLTVEGLTLRIGAFEVTGSNPGVSHQKSENVNKQNIKSQISKNRQFFSLVEVSGHISFHACLFTSIQNSFLFVQLCKKLR